MGRWNVGKNFHQLKQDQIGLDKDEVGSGSQSVGLQGPLGSRDKPTGSLGVKGRSYWVPRGQGVGLQGPRIKGCPTGSRVRPIGYQRGQGGPGGSGGPGGPGVQCDIGGQICRAE